MNAKEAVKFIERKFNKKVKEVENEYNTILDKKRQEIDDQIHEVIESVKDIYLDELHKVGLTHIQRKNLDMSVKSGYRWDFSRYDINEINSITKERDNKIKAIKQEQEDFTDKVLILGVKNNEVKAKLEELIK